MSESLAGALIAVVIGAAVSAVAQWLTERARGEAARDQTLDDRIKLLVRSLDDASRVVSEMEGEIRSRHDLVEQLRREQKLLELDREQVEAVAQQISGEVHRESRRTFWMGFAQNALFFALGVAVTLIISP